MTSKQKQADGSRIAIDYDVHTTSDGSADPNDRWSRDSTDTSMSVNGLTKVTHQYSDLEVPFQVLDGIPYYLVVVRYSTGDSFGSDSGQYEFVDLFETLYKAEAAVKELLSTSGDYQYKREDGSIIKGHASWIGYFESLESVEVQTVYLI